MRLIWPPVCCPPSHSYKSLFPTSARSAANFLSSRKRYSTSTATPSSSRCVLSVSCAGVIDLPLIFMPLPPQAALRLRPPLGRWDREYRLILLLVACLPVRRGHSRVPCAICFSLLAV